MIAAARAVLADCEAALEMLEDEENPQRWRVLWAGAMALLRAVGHVLQKVDGESATLRPLIDAAYNRWKANRSENAVFWEFIEEERNSILKEYRFHVLESGEVDIVVVGDAGNADSGGLSTSTELFTLGENIFKPVTGGFGEGEDARDIYRDAVSWWYAELSGIEARLRASRQ